MAPGEGGRSAAGGPGGGAAAAAAGVDSRELVVPLPRAGLLHLCVEYPGYVADEHRVLDTLGGLPGIARQLQENPKSLPLRLRPQDLNCHANFGGREPSRRLLLKLTRPAAAAAAAAGAEAAAASSSSSIGSWSAEVVATLPYTYRFTHPADYQYVAHDSRPVDAQGLQQQQGNNPPGFQPQPLLCPPPLFAKQPQFDYAYKGYMAAQGAGQGGGQTAGAAGRKKGGSGVMASFFDLEVPQPLPEASLAAAAAAHPDSMRILRQLLQQRPVWPAAALHEAVAAAGGGSSSSGRYPMDDLLPKLCFKFRNGPWKNAWTQRGYDPRATPAARQWQCLEYHLPSEWYSKIAEHKKAAALAQEAAAAAAGISPGHSQQQAASAAVEAPSELPPLASSYCQLLRFEAVPTTQSCSLQLGSVADSVVQGLLSDPTNQAQHCSDTGGWLASAAQEAIKKRIKERFQAVIDGCPIEDEGEVVEEEEQQQQGAAEAGSAQGQAAWAGAAGEEAMQVDGQPPAAGGVAEESAMDADDLAQQAQQHLHIQQQQRQGGTARPPGAALAAAAAVAAGAAAGRGEGLQILPSGLADALHDYLAHLPEQEDGEEDGEEDDGAGGYTTDEEDGGPEAAAGAGQSEEEDE